MKYEKSHRAILKSNKNGIANIDPSAKVKYYSKSIYATLKQSIRRSFLIDIVYCLFKNFTFCPGSGQIEVRYKSSVVFLPLCKK